MHAPDPYGAGMGSMVGVLASLLTSLVAVAIIGLVAYVVIRRAVRDGILDARRLEREQPDLYAEPAWRRWQRR